MVKEITQEQIDRENKELFDSGKIKVSMSNSEVIDSYDEAIRLHLKFNALMRCEKKVERQILVALSSISTVIGNDIVATVDERAKRIITACLDITDLEYADTIDKMIDDGVLNGMNGSDVIIRKRPFHDVEDRSLRLVGLDSTSETSYSPKGKVVKSHWREIGWTDDD